MTVRYTGGYSDEAVYMWCAQCGARDGRASELLRRSRESLSCTATHISYLYADDLVRLSRVGRPQRRHPRRRAARHQRRASSPDASGLRAARARSPRASRAAAARSFWIGRNTQERCIYGRHLLTLRGGEIQRHRPQCTRARVTQTFSRAAARPCTMPTSKTRHGRSIPPTHSTLRTHSGASLTAGGTAMSPAVYV